MLTIAFHTLGCKLNFAETATIARSLPLSHFKLVSFKDIADIYVINTCSVTDNADKRFHYICRSLLRKNPEAKIVAMGCYAQLAAEEIGKIEGVDLVLGTKDKYRLTEQLLSGDVSDFCSTGLDDTCQGAYSSGERTRSFLKIQDGCDYKCTYCTIPKARGASRSQNMDKVLENAEKIAANGIKEIVLTGVNTGDYKPEVGSFAQLLKKLCEIEGIERIRMSSIEPNLLTNEIIDICKNEPKLQPHFHIPLQSGSDDILKAMKRRYNTKMYREKIGLIKEAMPDASIGADVIVGFPGESNGHFRQTFNFIDAMDISYLHVFTYSERPGTEAAGFAGRVSKQKRAERSKELHILGEQKRSGFYKKHSGEKRPVLWEGKEKGGLMSGFTDNYIRVTAPYDPKTVGKITVFTLPDV